MKRVLINGRAVEVGHLMLERRWCFAILDQDPATHDGYVPSVVIEDVAGHFPCMGNGPCAAPYVWGKTKKDAEDIAAAQNSKRGITEYDALNIVASSIRASNKEGK